MEEKIDLIQYISEERLQDIQNSFTALVGMGTNISDADGSLLTQSAGMCDFCKFTRVSRTGAERCRKCDSEGSERAFREGKPIAYTCHAGLTDFVAPITIDGQRVGCFTGGQVRMGELDEERIRQTAKDIGVNPEMYLMLAKKTSVISEDMMKKALDFVNSVSNCISDMAYKQYQLEKANMEVEYAAKLKEDFLANMSHEIRTPMNGVIGMAELALREDLPVTAREYINQIKASGKTLLTIINDILDFSKIESGKMDIFIDEYEPLSLVNDVANVVLTRIGEKPIELMVDVDGTMPSKLLGDSIRLKQVLLNLANNAVKFTSLGRVMIRMNYKRIGEDEIDLKVTVQDTGIGIRKEDLQKLFQSFQQVDSKRNRAVEGTGLGLAICKRLVNLMNGEINVESTYGEGSTFSFHVPQKIGTDTPSITVVNAEKLNVVGVMENPFLQEQLRSDIYRMGGHYVGITNIRQLLDDVLDHTDYLFVDESVPAGQVETIANLHEDLNIVVVIDFKNHVEFVQKNITVLKKPVYTLNLANLFNHVKNDVSAGLEDEDFVFVAPEANVLIVDDNAVNLTVAAGILKPLQMQIDTAFSGKEAIDKIGLKKYDLIFMDHMMPELDGVETTRLIRRFHPNYNEVPIIALTANVVAGTKDMFIREGMNDFVAKPIEIKSIVSKLHKWLPQEKQIRVGSLADNTDDSVHTDIAIEGLDTQYAVKLLGSESLYWSVLKDYYKVIDQKAELIRNLFDEQDWGNYTIEVHALKSASRQIGALELSDLAAEMEKAGNARNTNKIRKMTEKMLQQYLRYKDILQPLCEQTENVSEKVPVEEAEFAKLLDELGEALENLDMDEMDRVMSRLMEYSYDDIRDAQVEALRNAIENIDVDTSTFLVEELKETIQQSREGES